MQDRRAPPPAPACGPPLMRARHPRKRPTRSPRGRRTGVWSLRVWRSQWRSPRGFTCCGPLASHPSQSPARLRPFLTRIFKVALTRRRRGSRHGLPSRRSRRKRPVRHRLLPRRHQSRRRLQCAPSSPNQRLHRPPLWPRRQRAHSCRQIPRPGRRPIDRRLHRRSRRRRRSCLPEPFRRMSLQPCPHRLRSRRRRHRRP